MRFPIHAYKIRFSPDNPEDLFYGHGIVFQIYRCTESKVLKVQPESKH